MADPQQALLLARFMIEDNSSELVSLDPENCCKVAIVKSVFRNLVGNYVLLDSASDRKLWDEITAIISKFETGLKSQFDQFSNAKILFIQPKDLDNVFTQLFIELTEQQKEYILLRLFTYTSNINKIMYMKLFEIFKPGSYVDRLALDHKKHPPRAHPKHL